MTIKGKIYDEDSTLQGVLIVNLSQNDTVYSGTKGDFRIFASINDSIVFKSLFHYSKRVRVKPEYFNGVIVFELKKEVNELGEVLLTNKLKKKPFEPIEYSIEMGFSIKEDIKRNPHLYMPKSSYSRGINFVGLIKLIRLNKLFKKPATIRYIKHKQIDSLFSNSKLFNDKLLIEVLKIPKEHKYLFFEYCETRKLNVDLLSNPDNLILLDSVYSLGRCFQKYTLAYQ